MLDLRQEGFLASGFAMGYCIGPVITGILLDTWQTVQHRGTRITPWPLVVTTQSDDDRSNRVRAGEWGISRWQPDTITTQSPVFFLLDMLGGFLFFWEPGTSTPLNQGQVGKATNIDFVCKSTGTLPSCHWIGFSLATLKSEASFLWGSNKTLVYFIWLPSLCRKNYLNMIGEAVKFYIIICHISPEQWIVDMICVCTIINTD